MKVVISGYGKMGKIIEKILSEKEIECVAKTNDIQSLRVDNMKKCVCIDFTTPSAFRENYKFLAENFGAVVVGTTGWNDIGDEIKRYFEECDTTLVYASNFSIGVNLFFATADFLTKKIAATGGYSPYVVEMHHVHKLDAPSGTARTLADIVDSNLSTKTDIQSVRCGEIPGIHTLGLEGMADRITLTHEAFSREGFARGAVLAAEKAEKIKGVFDFRDIVLSDIC